MKLKVANRSTIVGAILFGGMALAQDAVPPCGPDAQGMFTAYCHASLLEAERIAQHARSYRLGYEDGCKASGSSGSFSAEMIQDAQQNFGCNVTFIGISWGGGIGTIANAGSPTGNFGQIIAGIPGADGGTSSFENPLSGRDIDLLIQNKEFTDTLKEYGFERTPFE